MATYTGPYTNDTPDLWIATWPSLGVPWHDTDRSSPIIRHDIYLATKRDGAASVNLTVDPFMGKPANPFDSTPPGWQGFYPNLTADQVEQFGRATNPEVNVHHLPNPQSTSVLFKLFVLQHSQQSPHDTYHWQPIQQSLVRCNGPYPIELLMRIRKAKKRKGTPTQATAIYMLQASDMMNTFELDVHYSSMFGIIRRSYVAQTKGKENGGSVDEDQSGASEDAPLNISSDQADEPFEDYEQAVAGPSNQLDFASLIPPFQIPIENPQTHRHVLSVPETSQSFYAIRVASYLGLDHRHRGFNEAPTEIEAPLQYYTAARKRMIMATRLQEGWTETLSHLATRAAHRLEETTRRLKRFPSQRRYAVYNFHGGYNGPGTIVVDGYGNVIELNADPVTGRSAELHDNVAILARWVHMQGIMSKEQIGYDSKAIREEVYANTLFPYYQTLTDQPPTPQQIVRFWTFLDLEYTEYWFYFLQVADPVPLYRMTLALQRLQTILQQLESEYPLGNPPLPSMLMPISPERAFWFRDLPELDGSVFGV